MPIEQYLIDGLIAVAVLNAIASIAVALSSSYDRFQKCAQIALIWIVPVLGVILVGGFLIADTGRPRLAQTVTHLEGHISDVGHDTRNH